MVADIDRAPASVQAVFNSFVRLTKEELWSSEEELRAYIYADNNYEKLLRGEIGINLIQTHTAMSLRVMDDWAEYLFQTAKSMIGQLTDTDESAESLADIKAFCVGRVHNIWGNDRNEDNPEVTLQFDVAGWMRSPLSTPVSECKFPSPVEYRFSFPDSKKEEMAAQILRYGTTATGIGRIMAQMGRDRIWREAEALSEAAPLEIESAQPSVTA